MAQEGGQERVHSLEVGRAPREGLDIDSPLIGVQFEQVQGPLLTQQLGLVNVLISSIVPGVGATLTVLVGHARAQGLHHGSAGEVLGGNQLQTTDLTGLLAVDEVGNLWINVLKLSIILRDFEACGWRRDMRSEREIDVAQVPFMHLPPSSN